MARRGLLREHPAVTRDGSRTVGLREGAQTVFRRAEAKRIVRDFVASFEENDLLTYASAIAFRVLFAVVPLALAGLALLGFLDLTEVWEGDIAPQVQENMSAAAYSVVDDTVQRILTTQQGFWLTLGLAIAIWGVSGAVRTVMGALNLVYGTDEARTLWVRLPLSIALAVAVSAALLLATLTISLGEHVVPAPGGFVGSAVLFVVRWGVAIVLMTLSVWLLIRMAPSSRQPIAWVSLGSVLVVVFWIATSLAFGWYVRSVAAYGTVYGNLASVVVLLTYLYLSSIVFLAGVQVDALLRERVSGSRDGARG